MRHSDDDDHVATDQIHNGKRKPVDQYSPGPSPYGRTDLRKPANELDGPADLCRKLVPKPTCPKIIEVRCLTKLGLSIGMKRPGNHPGA